MAGWLTGSLAGQVTHACMRECCRPSLRSQRVMHSLIPSAHSAHRASLCDPKSHQYVHTYSTAQHTRWASFCARACLLRLVSQPAQDCLRPHRVWLLLARCAAQRSSDSSTLIGRVLRVHGLGPGPARSLPLLPCPASSAPISRPKYRGRKRRRCNLHSCRSLRAHRFPPPPPSARPRPGSSIALRCPAALKNVGMRPRKGSGKGSGKETKAKGTEFKGGQARGEAEEADDIIYLGRPIRRRQASREREETPFPGRHCTVGRDCRAEARRFVSASHRLDATKVRP